MALPDSTMLALAKYVGQYKMLVAKYTNYILDSTTVIIGEIDVRERMLDTTILVRGGFNGAKIPEGA